MNRTLNIQKSLAIFGIPLLLMATLIVFAKSSLFNANSSALSLAITIDLLLTTPFVYFLLIRKTSIPKTTVVPFVVLGIVIATFILPTENQFYLNLFKTWVLPLIELSILSFVIYNVIKGIKRYKHNKARNPNDFYNILKSTCYDILPRGGVIPFVTEVAVIYYGFISWKKRKLKPNEFSYHKDSGTVGLLIALLFLIAIETVAIHLLLTQWNTIAAWILTGLSIYSGIQILGFLKSMSKRPIVIQSDKLVLRYGIMNETIISIADIESIELSTKDIELDKTTRKLSFLGNLEGHNTVLTLKNENLLIGLYGIKRPYKVLALQVDEKVKFKNEIELLLNTETLS